MHLEKFIVSNKGKYKKVKPSFYKKAKVVTKSDKLPKQLAANSSCDYILINQEEMDILSRYILDYPNIETGGQLFGYWTYDGKPVVLFVLGPGPKAGHYDTFFSQDLNYLKSRALVLQKKYGLNHIGEWHSHHQLGLAYPSGHDARNISTNMRRLGYSRFLLCIGTCTNSESSINAFMFKSDNDGFNQVPWDIRNIESPYRKLINATNAWQFDMPRTAAANMQRLFVRESGKTEERISYDHTYWLKREGNSKVLKAIIDAVSEASPMQDCVPTIDSNNEVHLETFIGVHQMEDIHFPKEFPIEPPIINDAFGNRMLDASLWNFNGDIINSFITYYNILKNKEL